MDSRDPPRDKQSQIRVQVSINHIISRKDTFTKADTMSQQLEAWLR
jgi:hypothetical protein